MLASVVDYYNEQLQQCGVDVATAEIEWTVLKQDLYSKLVSCLLPTFSNFHYILIEVYEILLKRT